MFVDRVKVELQAGSGGNGCVSFRREWSVPRGGPDGGRGGDGGSVVFVADASMKSLSYFRFHPLLRAKNGGHGEGNNRYGRKGADLVLPVPLGTVIKNGFSESVLYDFLNPGQKFLAARGGRGGRGNAAFATSTHQAPREHEPGKPGEQKDLVLELKLIADVGLVGFPNVGKSTLISKVSAAKPLIADYPFTTLTPNLGVVDIGTTRTFVMADIPGLIEGAHRGQGLGIEFLRHVERTKILVHIVDVSPYSGRDPVKDFGIVLEELEAFNPELARRPEILVANKIDLLGSDASRLEALKRLARRKRLAFFPISALKSTGLKPLVAGIVKALERLEKSRDRE
jgi:GTP-binding protein